MQGSAGLTRHPPPTTMCVCTCTSAYMYMKAGEYSLGSDNIALGLGPQSHVDYSVVNRTLLP